MNISVELTAIDTKLENIWYRDLARDRQRQAQTNPSARQVEHDDFDEDDLERAIDPEGEPEPDTDAGMGEQVTPSLEAPSGMYYPVTVYANDLREYYGRRHEERRPGTRLAYRSGAARFVKETYEEVRAKFVAAEARYLGAQG